MKVETVENPVLVVPDGRSIGYFTHEKPAQLTENNLSSAQLRFLGMEQNFADFYAIAADGRLLDRVLRATSTQSFIEQTLGRVERDASFKNYLTQLLNGHHTHVSFNAVYLPWVSIFIDYFTSTPIPENIAAVEKAQTSLKSLAQLVEQNKDIFYNALLKGVAIPKIDGKSLRFDGLEFVVLGDDEVVSPRKVSPESTRVRVGKEWYFNGLPGDRGEFPTFLMPEGAKLVLKVKNTTANRLYALVPTINGMPFRISNLAFSYDGFESSDLPIHIISPEIKYLKPGEELEFGNFFSNRTIITTEKTQRSYPSEIWNYGLVELSFIYGPIFEKQITAQDKELLDKVGVPYLAEQIMHGSRMASLKEFLKRLQQPKQTDIYAKNPVPADAVASSQLDNPFLGSIGFVVLEVSPPPVKARHTVEYIRPDAYGRRGQGATKRGLAGLAEVGGGVDQAAQRTNFWEAWQFDGHPHTFRGYLPANLMSLKR